MYCITWEEHEILLIFSQIISYNICAAGPNITVENTQQSPKDDRLDVV